MNALFSATLLAFGIMPGVVLFHSFFSDPLSRRALDLPRGFEFVWYLILAVPLLIVWGWLAATVGVSEYGPSPSLVLSLPQRLSQSTNRDTLARLDVLATKQAIGWLAALAISWFLGSLARRVVWSLRLDLMFRPIQLRNDWYYPLLGRLSGLPRDVIPVADVMVLGAEKSRLFRGIVIEFDLARSGALAAVTLTDVRRGKGRGDEFAWHNVPGDRLIILGERIHSINMTYVEPVTEPPEQWSTARAILRSFVKLER